MILLYFPSRRDEFPLLSFTRRETVQPKGKQMYRYPSILVFTVLVVSFPLLVGCSRTPCYKGYVPVTEKEALAFGQELVDRYEHGDKSWYIHPEGYWESPKVFHANAALMYFNGLDIPNHKKNPPSEKEKYKKIEKSDAEKSEADIFWEEYDHRFKNPVLKCVKPMYGTYSVYISFTFDKTTDSPTQAQFLSTIETTQERYFPVVKIKKTGEIVIAGDGTILPKPKGRK